MSLLESPDDVLFLHNARCSKSRAVAAILAEKGIPHRERFYLEDPLTRAALVELGRCLGLSPRDWIRTGEAAYREANLGPGSSEDELLDAMAEHPILVQRPVVVTSKGAKIGRPPEGILELFGE